MSIKCACKHIVSYYSIHTIYKVASGQVTNFEGKSDKLEKLGKKNLKMKNAKIYTGRNSCAEAWKRTGQTASLHEKIWGF